MSHMTNLVQSMLLRIQQGARQAALLSLMGLTGSVALGVQGCATRSAQAPISGSTGGIVGQDRGGVGSAPGRAPSAPVPRLEVPLEPITFSQLADWRGDAVEQAWGAWLQSCTRLPGLGQPWVRLCQEAEQITALAALETGSAPRREVVARYFEVNFQPMRLGGGVRSHNTLTGYYEPVVRGSRTRQGAYQWPLYRTPSDPSLLRETRESLERSGALRGQELVWLDDPTEGFFLQIQGSGQVVLPDGRVMRVGFAAANGHPFRSIGRWLADQGEMRLAETSMQGIKAWVARHPARRDELFWQNPRMIFFRELPASLGANEGPIGALGVPLTAERSIAVDPRYAPLGFPVFLTAQLVGESRPRGRLVMAQDTGSAIQGPHRTDFYYGSGEAAGERAGKTKALAQQVLLWPLGYPVPLP